MAKKSCPSCDQRVCTRSKHCTDASFGPDGTVWRGWTQAETDAAFRKARENDRARKFVEGETDDF